MIDWPWAEIIQNTAERFGYTIDYIGSLSFAQVEGLWYDKKKEGRVLTAEEMTRLAKKMKERDENS